MHMISGDHKLTQFIARAVKVPHGILHDPPGCRQTEQTTSVTGIQPSLHPFMKQLKIHLTLGRCQLRGANVSMSLRPFSAILLQFLPASRWKRIRQTERDEVGPTLLSPVRKVPAALVHSTIRIEERRGNHTLQTCATDRKPVDRQIHRQSDTGILPVTPLPKSQYGSPCRSVTCKTVTQEAVPASPPRKSADLPAFPP